MLEVQNRRNQRANADLERLGTLPLEGGDPRPGSLEGYAAIDPGSTGTRAVIAISKIDETTGKRRIVEDGIKRIQDFREDDDRDRRTTRGEWPSKCCPFDGPPYYVGYEADAQDKKRTISIKAIPYFRTQDDDGHPFTRALYDHSRSLRSEVDRRHFDDVLDTIFNEVVQRILSMCKASNIKLRSLAVCVPQTWSRRETPIQEYLGPILDRTVAIDGVETTFALEAQSQAQYIIKHYFRQLKTCNELMVLDFGGHSMGGSDTQLHWGPANDRPTFHAPPGSDFGVRGGYELWEIGIGNCIDKTMKRNPKKYPQKRRHVIKAKLLEGFFNSKARINFENPHRLHTDLVDHFKDPKASYAVYITAEQLKAEWENAFRDAINMAARNIRNVVTEGRKLRVLLTGGSANSQNLRAELNNVCDELREKGFDVTLKVVAKDMDTVLAPVWSIAEGAACCHATAMDVDEFFDLGAALGLQIRTAMANGGEWAGENCQLLFCKRDGVERHPKVDIDIDGTKRKFRIVADPFLMASQGKVSSSDVILVKDAYDIGDLELKYIPSFGGDALPIPNGRHTLEVAEVVCSGREAIAVLRLRPNLSDGARRSKRMLDKMAIDGHCNWSLLFELPLTSCGPSNLVELDIDRVRGRLWKLDGYIHGARLGEQQREISVELGTPFPSPAKRRRVDGRFPIRPDPQGDIDELSYDWDH
ncbi:hypothetical protein KVR01_006054 [Diaporthe batatas]|uniref:uncharacterized protein n=1 Tax=Diaporthe batatas TaxID=748121 RepID=UPI001D039EB7|nr:uncharacterized protein KVR01_006054 [Diaporthe batatas]KAG8164136.1 hypothetical protein KVR01_006054 [Diaporthe batatas]